MGNGFLCTDGIQCVVNKSAFSELILLFIRFLEGVREGCVRKSGMVVFPFHQTPQTIEVCFMLQRIIVHVATNHCSSANA